MDTSIEVGDWIRVNDISGKVVEVRWRHTAVDAQLGDRAHSEHHAHSQSGDRIGRRMGAPQYSGGGSISTSTGAISPLT